MLSTTLSLPASNNPIRRETEYFCYLHLELDYIVLKMVFGVVVSLVSFLCNSLWFLSQFAIFLIHYFFVLLILLCIVSKFIKLKAVPLESLQKIFSPSSFPISHLGSIFDVPENTKASFEYVRTGQN